MAWAGIAPRLAARFEVIVPDLRGYGESDAPPDDAAHTVYSKREMARDVAGLLDAFGHARAHVVGHDRGARVAYRMALDMPGRIERLGILEIVPTGDFWRMWQAELATAAYHWTFLAQPHPLPETLIAADPAFFIDWTMAGWTKSKDLSAFSGDALDCYRAQAARPERLTAMCADYRAGATTDRAIDEADRENGRHIEAPLLFLHGDSGFPARTGMPAGLWHGWASNVTAQSIASGHFLMEENPDAVTEALLAFLVP